MPQGRSTFGRKEQRVRLASKPGKHLCKAHGLRHEWIAIAAGDEGRWKGRRDMLGHRKQAEARIGHEVPAAGIGPKHRPQEPAEVAVEVYALEVIGARGQHHACKLIGAQQGCDAELRGIGGIGGENRDLCGKLRACGVTGQHQHRRIDVQFRRMRADIAKRRIHLFNRLGIDRTETGGILDSDGGVAVSGDHLGVVCYAGLAAADPAATVYPDHGTLRPGHTLHAIHVEPLIEARTVTDVKPGCDARWHMLCQPRLRRGIAL